MLACGYTSSDIALTRGQRASACAEDHEGNAGFLYRRDAGVAQWPTIGGAPEHQVKMRSSQSLIGSARASGSDSCLDRRAPSAVATRCGHLFEWQAERDRILYSITGGPTRVAVADGPPSFT